MNTLSYKTASVSSEAAAADKQWLLIDAKDVVLGRLASVVAKLLRGKYKVNYTPNVDCGDNVVIINADKIALTGNKLQGKVVFSYSGYPGGRHDKTAGEILAKNPAKLLEHSVKGMLPKNRLGAEMFRNLYVFAGEQHNKEAQQPKSININELL